MASEVQGTNSERTGAAEAGAAWRSSIGEVIAGRSDGGVICGDCLDVMAAMDAASVDTIITDPPYGLQFMGKAWDHGVPGVPFWQAALRVAKPGAFLLAFGGTRTFHRLTCAIEDAGWEIRDCMMWLYGQGFPKSANISKMLDATEKNKWLKVNKALDNMAESAILEAWKEYSSAVKSVGLSFRKSTTATGTNTPESGFALAPVMVQANPKNSGASVVLAELSSGEARHTSESSTSVLTNVEGGKKLGHAKSVARQQANGQVKPTPIGIAQCIVRGWQSENITDKLKAGEALKIWLGSKPSSKAAATDALCAALTADLKHTILSQSETYRNADTTSQTDFASAINVTITESTAASLISFTVDTVRREAIDKAAGAEREIVGQNPNDRHRRENAMADYGLQGGVGRGDITAPATDAAKLWSGYGTALKPAWEPIIVAMKPTDGTFANNALAHGVAGLNIDGGRIAIGRGDPTVRFDTPGNGMVGQGGVYEGGYSGNYAGATKPHPDSMRHHAQGRWPANVILDEQSGQSASVILDEQSGQSASPEKVTRGRNRQIEAFGLGRQEDVPCFGDSGGASRFFYVAKASRAERNAGCEGFYWRRDKTAAIGHVRVSREVWATLDEKDRAEGNIHPTVKPLAVMEWLCKLTATPTGGVVLDPFAGSGSTCIAARNVGRRYIGIDNDAQPGSCEIARARLAAGPISPQSEGVGSRVVKGQRTLFAVGGAG